MLEVVGRELLAVFTHDGAVHEVAQHLRTQAKVPWDQVRLEWWGVSSSQSKLMMEPYVALPGVIIPLSTRACISAAPF